MVYLVIIFIGARVAAIDHIEMSSMEACEVARTAIYESNESKYTKMICIKK